ncbi:MAG: hypothetical protein QF662_09230, partial [Phycisphaerae bacterium]|nr:hypothetical protein [Phycisphaerae bacterium]
MRAGFSQQNVTPPVGTAMSGFAGRDKKDGCQGIHDDLFVRALWLSHDGSEALILGFDLLFFSRDVADRLKGAIGRRLDVAPHGILLNTSHTHSGPCVDSWAYGGHRPPNEAYLEAL